MTQPDSAIHQPLLLILDLDETLIHASGQPLSRPADFQVYNYFVYKRPYLQEFLLGCSQHFQLAVWSSASDDYVEEVVKWIFPPEIPLAFVWDRSRCTHCLDVSLVDSGHYTDYYASHYNYLKVLKKVRNKGYRLERMLIVDDTPSKARRNYGNVIYPKEYLGDSGDNELLLLFKYLMKIKDVENVRTIEKRNWKSIMRPD
jgi:carboxy-terminal domain RNA polymerase II polypeptide A small phosphatase